ncbi:CBS domain-containing protein [Amycolatopsis thermalba]|uniref:CBS domain-containing protein n=1 Tax=Amycolatopsis thermalba TaxID=944492 RepID=UPI000E24148F|nr:CBS domain-containing protein [Amycolatopsis thermalba]
MHAADVVEPLPTARLDEAALSAARTLARHGRPALAVLDEQDQVVGCLSALDLVRLALPRYLRDEPCLARTFDEAHADRVVATLATTAVRDVIGEVAARIPVARPDATVVELAEMMARQSCPAVLVERSAGGAAGVVTASRLLELLVSAVEDRTR